MGGRRARARARPDHRERAARDRPRVRRHAAALPAGHRPLRRLRAARAAGGRLDPTFRTRRTMTRRLLALALALSACPLAACGGKDEPTAAAGGAEPRRLMRDDFPNAEYAGNYAAQAAA